MKLRGKYALVSGASRGLGARIARRFAEEGAALALCARSEKALAQIRRRLLQAVPDLEVMVLPTDISREKQVDRLARAVEDAFPHLDILVNCAGVAGPRGLLPAADWQEWKKAIVINLLGTAYMIRTFLPALRRSRRGKIINISGGGATRPLPGLSSYAASKAAVVRLTETLARELGSQSIDVNAVAPGVLATRMVDDFLELGAEILGQQYVEEVARQKRDPLPAMDRAADLCVFLASEQGDGISGRLISAAWDPWKKFPRFRERIASSDIYTLRRIVPADRGIELE
ncbi:MAG TPA: SDR family oxidoreductase [Kiritimatiellae bacterium]|nr:SDR family oxidoreductase [Kiritimatiellia bacterium]